MKNNNATKNICEYCGADETVWQELLSEDHRCFPTCKSCQRWAGCNVLPLHDPNDTCEFYLTNHVKIDKIIYGG